MQDNIQKKDIKELLEAIDGIEVFVEIIVNQLKDGFQPQEDLMQFFAKIVAEPRLREAMDGMSKIGGELKDLDLLEIKELATRAMDFGFNVFYMFKK